MAVGSGAGETAAVVVLERRRRRWRGGGPAEALSSRHAPVLWHATFIAAGRDASLARPEVRPRPLARARGAWAASGGDEALCVSGSKHRAARRPTCPHRSAPGLETARSVRGRTRGITRQHESVLRPSGAECADARGRRLRLQRRGGRGPGRRRRPATRRQALNLSAARATSSDGGTRRHLTCTAGEPEGRAGAPEKRAVSLVRVDGSWHRPHRAEGSSPSGRRPTRKRRNLRNGRQSGVVSDAWVQLRHARGRAGWHVHASCTTPRVPKAART